MGEAAFFQVTDAGSMTNVGSKAEREQAEQRRLAAVELFEQNVAQAEIARRFGVMSIPTMIVFKDGQEAKRLVGAKGKGQLLHELSEFL